jgi:hypothetical protein
MRGDALKGCQFAAILASWRRCGAGSTGLGSSVSRNSSLPEKRWRSRRGPELPSGFACSVEVRSVTASYGA